MPWMTVRGNVQLPLVNRKGKKERDHLVTTAVKSVGLTKFIDRYPWELSGGMQQRVAIARALAYEPELLIMDEPFASVDAQTRIDLEDLILQVRKQYRMNVLLVTHDIDEAVYLGDRVIVTSHRPSIVTEVVKIPLGSDRDQVTTKGDPGSRTSAAISCRSFAGPKAWPKRARRVHRWYFGAPTRACGSSPRNFVPNQASKELSMSIANKLDRSAVLIMDYQPAILRLLQAGKDPLTAKAQNVLTKAREAGLKIIYVNVALREGYPEVSERNKRFSAIKKSQFLKPGAECEPDPSVPPGPNDVLVQKRQWVGLHRQ